MTNEQDEQDQRPAQATTQDTPQGNDLPGQRAAQPHLQQTLQELKTLVEGVRRCNIASDCGSCSEALSMVSDGLSALLTAGSTEQEECEHDDMRAHSTTYPHVLICQRCRKAECESCGSDLSDLYDTRTLPPPPSEGSREGRETT